MDLSDIFKKNVHNLNGRLENIGKKYPEVINALKFKNKDPHLDHMIHAFALISSSLEYKVEQQIPKEIKSIFLNLQPNDFKDIPPTGLIQIKPKKNKHLFVGKDTMIVDNNNFFKVNGNFYLSNCEIKKKSIGFWKNNYGIKILFQGTNLKELQNLDLWMDPELINGIFEENNQVKGSLINNEMYHTSFDLALFPQRNLNKFCVYSNQFCFVRIQNLKIQPSVEDVFEVFIPLKHRVNEVFLNIRSNLVVVENNFKRISKKITLNSSEPQLIEVENNNEVISVNKIIDLNTGDSLPNIRNSPNGWQMIHDHNNFFIQMNLLHSRDIVVETECRNVFIKLGNPYFEEYLPADLQWYETPHQVHKHESQKTFSHLSSFLFLKNFQHKDILGIISNLLATYENSFELRFTNVEIIESVKPIKLRSYSIPKLVNTLVANVNSNNYLLLHQITNEIRHRVNDEMDFLFTTPDGQKFFQNQQCLFRCF